MRWYLRFKLSYRDLAELARELGVSVAPSTILRWAVRYVPEFEKCWQAYERPVGDCPAGERKHELAEEHLAKTNITRGSNAGKDATPPKEEL